MRVQIQGCFHLVIPMPTLINMLCELADFSEVQSFFNQRGYCLVDDAIYHAEDNTLADEFEISLSTVRSHLKNIYRKLGLSSRAEAVSFAARNNLL